MVTSRGQVSQVTPLQRGGQHRERNNYRPISVLPILSKIIEKHVAHSLLKYLQENNLLYELKSAFRSGHSTETALIRITEAKFCLKWIMMKSRD